MARCAIRGPDTRKFFADYPLVNFLRACMGLAPIPFTRLGFPEGLRLLAALGESRRLPRETTP